MADLGHHAARIAELMDHLENAAEAPPRELTYELLEHVDHLHRTCVWRLFELLTELGGKGLVDRLTTDSAVKTLFVLYDLIPSEPLRPVVSTAEVTAPYSGGFTPLGMGKIHGLQPAWRMAFALGDLPPGSLQAVEIDGTPVLLCSLEDGVFAYRNTCVGSVLPLHLGTLAGDSIHCPWHGCRYDARTGQHFADAGLNLEAFQVTLSDGMIHVAVRAPE